MSKAKKGAKKAAPKKSAAKKSSAKKQKPEQTESQDQMLARRRQESSDHKAKVREELELPKSYGFNPNEIDPQRSAEIERDKAAKANRERLNKEAEGQKVG